MRNRLRNKRLILAICLVVVFILGMLAKLYQGPHSVIISNKIAGAFYVTFWCFFFALVFYGKSSGKVVIIVLIITYLLEFTQLCTSPILESIRSTFIGRSMIGSTFSWSDFPYYFVGALLAFLILHRLDKKLPKD